MAIKCFSIRIDDELLEKVRSIAKREIRSVNRQLLMMIQDGIRSYEESQKNISTEHLC